jgi:hypothetical protein
MLRFELAPHPSQAHIRIVEVWKGEERIATIFPREESLIVASQFLGQIDVHRATRPPAAEIAFEDHSRCLGGTT